MSIQEEEFLLAQFNMCDGVFWCPDPETCKKVISITDRPAQHEPSLCANFGAGSYVSLFFCELNEFIVGKRLNNF